MTRKEKNKIIQYADDLTNEQLEKEYYKSVFNSLGSQTEEMYDLGYDIVDIIEREKQEKYFLEYSNILETCCVERGIKLWTD